LSTDFNERTSTKAYCTACGAQMQGHFCGECGTPIAGEPQDPFGDLEAGAAPPAVFPQREARSTRRTPLVVTAGVVMLAIVAVLALVLLRHNSPSKSSGQLTDTLYRQKVATAFGPLLGANQQLSRELRTISGTNSGPARDAASAARQALASTTGALNVLTAPAGSPTVASNARQVLTREDAFLSAVSAVLADPTNPSRNELINLQANLQSALTAAGPSIAGNSPAVSGATELTAWAPRAARQAATRHRARSASGPTSASANPYAHGQDCGDGVYAGPNTSCSFANNVRQAWYDAPGMTNSVTVYSPTTGRDYEMNCAPTGVAISCSGGNDASMTFQQ
jgi:hypothetical protein